MQKIILRADKVKPFLQGHPWVFSGAVAKIEQPGTVGLAEVCTPDGQTIGFGFSDPGSQLVCRIFHFGPKPETGFQPAYWTEKFRKAMALRTSALMPANTDSYRLIHAEGDAMPGIVADVYGGKVVVIHTLLDATGQWIDTWVRILQDLGFPHIYHRHGQDKQARWKTTDPPAQPMEIMEHGVRFWVDIVKGQKTGFFIDQRENRKFLGSFSKGKKVLNAFGFTGGFSMYALAAGAREVHTVDISEDACALARSNVLLNQFPEERHIVEAADCFKYLRTMATDFDLVILDPPAFAKSKQALDQAARGYKDINRVALQRMAPGSFLATFSCSQHMDAALFRKVLFSAALDAGKQVQVVHTFHQPFDHPVHLNHPEGEYLKGFLVHLL
jgi:23S rRNA (cytosine1962-C5)-methyltransferase